MNRTQIYLGEAETSALAEVSRKTGLSMSQLIRDAILAQYAHHGGPEEAERILLRTAGAWRRARGDDGAAYVERARGGRLARLHGKRGAAAR